LGLGHRLAYVFHCCARVIVITALACHRDVERGLGRSFPPWVELALPPGSRAELLRLRAALDLPPARPPFYCSRAWMMTTNVLFCWSAVATNSAVTAGNVWLAPFGSDVMECNQSIFNASALTTGAQRTISAARDCRNFWGVESRIGSLPASIRVC